MFEFEIQLQLELELEGWRWEMGVELGKPGSPLKTNINSFVSTAKGNFFVNSLVAIERQL